MNCSAKWRTSAVVDAFFLISALAANRVTLHHEVSLEGDAPLMLGDVAKLEGDACRYHAIELPQQKSDGSVDLSFVMELLEQCAAPVFQWEFRGGVTIIERTEQLKPPPVIPALNRDVELGPQTLREVIAARLRLRPDQIRIQTPEDAPLNEGVWTLRTHPTVRTVRARLHGQDHRFTVEIADEQGQWHPNWLFKKRSSSNHLDLPDLIKRGNSVSVERRLGGFLAQTSGRAMSSAHPGEKVLVRLDDGVIRQGTLRTDGVVQLMEGS